MAAEYKTYIEEAAILLRLLKKWEFAELRDAIGRVGGYFVPILDVIFPSWVNRQVENATHSLVGISRRDDFPAQIAQDECRAFADWLVEHNQKALLWKYRACNRLIFGRDPGGRPGLGSEVQGLAIAVEGAIQAMCPKPGISINSILPTMWDDATMAAYSKNHLLTQGVNSQLEAAPFRQRWRRRRGSVRVGKAMVKVTISVRAALFHVAW